MWLHQQVWIHDFAWGGEGNATNTALNPWPARPGQLAPPFISHWPHHLLNPSLQVITTAAVWTCNMTFSVLLIGHSHSGCEIILLTHWGWTPFLSFSLGCFSLLCRFNKDSSFYYELHLHSFQRMKTYPVTRANTYKLTVCHGLSKCLYSKLWIHMTMLWGRYHYVP